MAFITSMSGPQATSFWVRFFTESGIPENVAANYAVTFADNRITKNMLLDLNKEILHDMGIVLMGDVISILKHAKIVHAQLTREKVFQEEAAAKLMEVPPARRSTPASRIVDHYTKPITPLRTSDQYLRTVVSPDVSSKMPPTNLKRKFEDDDAPVPKVRRVLPEHEGGYKISLPSGSTPKTRKLLAQKKMQNKTVFQRLEQAPKVSSTSGNEVKKHTVKPALTKSSSSVFSRLGPAGKIQVSSSTDSADEDNLPTSMKQLPLQYLGILRTAPAPTRVIKKEVLTPSEFNKTVKQTTKLALDKRLGPKVTQSKGLSLKTRSITSEGILATGVKSSKSVKSRLGNTSTAPASTQSAKVTLAKRLGNQPATSKPTQSTKTIAKRLGNAPAVPKAGQRTKITFSSEANIVVRASTGKHKPITFAPTKTLITGSQLRTGIINTKAKITMNKVTPAQNVFKRLGPAISHI